MYQVSIREFGRRRVAALQHHGECQTISGTLQDARSVLSEQAVAAGPAIVVYPDEPPRGGHRKTFAGFKLGADDSVAAPLVLMDLPAGRHAVLAYDGPMDRLGEAWAYLRDVWMPENGEEIGGALPYELYEASPPEKPDAGPVTLICVPLE